MEPGKIRKITVTTKEFLQDIFFYNLGKLVEIPSPWISFSVIAIGIEVAGKCIDDNTDDWNKSGMSRIHFEGAINSLNSFEKYRPFLDPPFNLWTSFRNGFAHSFVPKESLSLSHGPTGIPHLAISTDGRIVNLKCEDLYKDLKFAFQEIFQMMDDKKFKPEGKMFQQRIWIQTI